MTPHAYWSIRREVWENRSVYIAPLCVTALALFGTLFTLFGLAAKLRAGAPVAGRFEVASSPIMLTTFIVGFFYSADALFGERRDRSILFWKSLPVSDRTTVLAKASIPTVVLPLIGLALSVTVQFILLVLGSMAVASRGVSPVRLWAEVNVFEQLFVLIYGVTVHVLWFAPVNAWLLLVSGWARRLPLMWAILPAVATAMLERIVFRTTFFSKLIQYRLLGGMREAFNVQITGQTRLGFAHLDPVKFLSSSGLWLGLVFAAACLAAAIRLRGRREPI